MEATMYTTVAQHRLVKTREMEQRTCYSALTLGGVQYWQTSMIALPFVLSTKWWMVIC